LIRSHRQYPPNSERSQWGESCIFSGWILYIEISSHTMARCPLDSFEFPQESLLYEMIARFHFPFLIICQIVLDVSDSLGTLRYGICGEKSCPYFLLTIPNLVNSMVLWYLGIGLVVLYFLPMTMKRKPRGGAGRAEAANGLRSFLILALVTLEGLAQHKRPPGKRGLQPGGRERG